MVDEQSSDNEIDVPDTLRGRLCLEKHSLILLGVEATPGCCLERKTWDLIGQGWGLDVAGSGRRANRQF